MFINAKLPIFDHQLFRLRNILLLVMLMVLGLPLGGLYFFRVYENELVQQTERELIGQGAALSAAFRQLARYFPHNPEPYGRPLSLPPPKTTYDPIIPSLNLINPIQPPRPAPHTTRQFASR